MQNFTFDRGFYFLKCLFDSWKAKIVVAACTSALISLLECLDDVSGHSDYYQLSSEVLKQNLILFRSDHSSLEMEK